MRTGARRGLSDPEAASSRRTCIWRPPAVEAASGAEPLSPMRRTIDHRVVDGEPAAAFLDQVIALLEEPSRLT